MTCNLFGLHHGLVVSLLHGLAGGFVGDVGRQFGVDDAGLNESDPDAGQELLTQGLRPSVDSPLGGGVDAVASACGAAGDGGDVDQITGLTVLELVEEDLSGGDRAEEVGFDHGPVVLVLRSGEGTEEHDPGVVDQDVGPAELVLHALCGGEEGLAVGDVGLDGDGAVGQFLGEGFDAVHAAGQERDLVAVGGEGAGGGGSDVLAEVDVLAKSELVNHGAQVALQTPAASMRTRISPLPGLSSSRVST